jgi:hypothetical protein
MSTLKISDIPTLARWTEVGVTEDDNSLNGYINSLKDTISELVLIEDDNAPFGDRAPSREYTIINKSCRLLANLLSDLKSIRREVHTARLINEAGQNPKKGGVQK